MNQWLSPAFRILIGVWLLLALLSLLLIISLQPIHSGILAVILRYIWVFVGGALLVVVVLNRIFDLVLTKHKDN